MLMKKSGMVVIVVLLTVSLVGNIYLASKINEKPIDKNPLSDSVEIIQESTNNYPDNFYIVELTDANSRDTYFSIHNIRQAHELSKGSGIKVGILDWCFGYSKHEDLYAGGVDFLNNPDTFNTWSQHGYWMAQVLKEIAPECEIYALNTHTEDDEEARMNALINAIDWAIENKLDILTLSQRPIESEYREAFDNAIGKAVENGIVTVFIHYDNPQNILPYGIAPFNDGMYTREPDVRIFQYDYNLLRNVIVIGSKTIDACFAV